ncbi:uncharacterized protein LOC129607310 [Condylostylus longicornis]|uniref:uncharacterized protein LOC129607310 n=1 Tax=Condylostylus longicornis TaxID=2530218 RepID=UPI00244E4E30|nr:uncharacterized protein LOC129607310 [Condylostylus longicornis]
MSKNGLDCWLNNSFKKKLFNSSLCKKDLKMNKKQNKQVELKQYNNKKHVQPKLYIDTQENLGTNFNSPYYLDNSEIISLKKTSNNSYCIHDVSLDKDKSENIYAFKETSKINDIIAIDEDDDIEDFEAKKIRFSNQSIELGQCDFKTIDCWQLKEYNQDEVVFDESLIKELEAEKETQLLQQAQQKNNDKSLTKGKHKPMNKKQSNIGQTKSNERRTPKKISCKSVRSKISCKNPVEQENEKAESKTSFSVVGNSTDVDLTGKGQAILKKNKKESKRSGENLCDNKIDYGVSKIDVQKSAGEFDIEYHITKVADTTECKINSPELNGSKLIVEEIKKVNQKKNNNMFITGFLDFLSKSSGDVRDLIKKRDQNTPVKEDSTLSKTQSTKTTRKKKGSLPKNELTDAKEDNKKKTTKIVSVDLEKSELIHTKKDNTEVLCVDIEKCNSEFYDENSHASESSVQSIHSYVQSICSSDTDSALLNTSSKNKKGAREEQHDFLITDVLKEPNNTITNVIDLSDVSSDVEHQEKLLNAVNKKQNHNSKPKSVSKRILKTSSVDCAVKAKGQLENETITKAHISLLDENEQPSKIELPQSVDYQRLLFQNGNLMIPKIVSIELIEGNCNEENNLTQSALNSPPLHSNNGQICIQVQNITSTVINGSQNNHNKSNEFLKSATIVQGLTQSKGKADAGCNNINEKNLTEHTIGCNSSANSNCNSNLKFDHFKSKQKPVTKNKEGIKKNHSFEVGNFVVFKNELYSNSWPVIFEVITLTALKRYEPVFENCRWLYKSTLSYLRFQQKKNCIKVPVKILNTDNGIITAQLDRMEIDYDYSKSIKESLVKYEELREPFFNYMLTVVSQALDFNFFQIAFQENNHNIMSKILLIDNIITKAVQKCKTSINWSNLPQPSIDELCHCTCKVPSKEEIKEHRCYMCSSTNIKTSLVFSGHPYNKLTLKLLKKNEIWIEEEYYFCQVCLQNVTLIHKLTHMKYSLYVKCKAKLSEIRDPNDVVLDTKKILISILNDTTWLEELFSEFILNLAEVDFIEKIHAT